MPVAVNPTDSNTPQAQRLEHLVKYGALSYPSRVAVTYYVEGKSHSLSYSDLWNHVRRVASVLRQHIPVDGPTPFVQLFLPNGSDQIVATLATLLAGAAFVPIALDSPPSWCRALHEQTRSQIFITNSTLKDDLSRLLASAGLECPIIYDVNDIEYHAADSQVSRELSTTDPAYVLFSSGTTGTPKGIMVPHSAVLNYCKASNTVFKATSNDKWLRAASYTFDVSIEELFLPLSLGAEIIIQPATSLGTLQSHLRFLDSAGVTATSMPTALWHQLVKHVDRDGQKIPTGLRLIVVGGEAAMTEALISWRKNVGTYPRVVNAYGPTETTISTTLWETHDFDKDAIMPIGLPLPGTKSYVVDLETGRLAGRNQFGVLYVSGPGLAIGYLGKPELTNAKFTLNKFSNEPGHDLVYNTGDLVWQDENGVLYFHGRVDLQVQVRGFRVEIEAVESCLLKHPSIISAAIHCTTEQQTTSLNAYIVQTTEDDPLTTDELLKHCKKSLAYYEIPARFYRIASMPLDRNEKINRRALAALPKEEFADRKVCRQGEGTDAPVDPVLARIWCECLEGLSLPGLNAGSNILCLGGQSLTLIMLASRIASEFGVSITFVELLQHAELADMSKLLAEKR
ncbi:acetyl-CoA synthetase-like protein [Ceratobasidium sp. AG-I]|nr:acetyl-CoA synthetase-like protein [Ceratobasidium sp. AG-I]